MEVEEGNAADHHCLSNPENIAGPVKSELFSKVWWHMIMLLILRGHTLKQTHLVMTKLYSTYLSVVERAENSKGHP